MVLPGSLSPLDPDQRADVVDQVSPYALLCNVRYHPTRCHAMSGIALRACSAIPGTDLAHVTRLRPRQHRFARPPSLHRPRAPVFDSMLPIFGHRAAIFGGLGPISGGVPRFLAVMLTRDGHVGQRFSELIEEVFANVKKLEQ
eukprot:3597177-Rhodomonas_salina.1